MPQGDVPVGVNLEGMVGHTECYALLGGNPARESHIWEYDPRGSHEERLVGLAAYFVPGGRADARSSGRLDCRRSEEHTSELQSPVHLVCRLLLEKKKKNRAEY